MSAEFIPGGVAAPPDPMIGMVLGGNYRLEALLGTGGMGNVYRAQHVRLPKLFAVKIVKSELGKDSAAFERFKREAEIASQIGNRHIVEVVDFNTLPDGSPYMVMEYLEGEELATRLARAGRLTLDECRHIMDQVVSALDAAHSRGIVHRDIKPENIFLCPVDGDKDFVKLLDFGLSKMKGSSKRLTANLSVMGTPWYMSPEQARGDADLDHRTDIYALGVVLYQVLTGRVPFEGENIYGVLTQIATQQPPAMSQFVPDIPPGLEAAVLRSLSKSPMDRPSTAGELWDEAQRGMEATFASVRVPGGSARARLEDGTPFRVPTPRSTPVIEHATQVSISSVPGSPDAPIELAPRKSLAPPVDLPAELPPQRSPMVIVGVSFLLTIGVVVGGYFAFSKASANVEPTVVVTPPPVEPLLASIQVSTTPATALLKLNGALTSSPLQLKWGGPEATLQVEAPGYVSQVLTIHPNGNQSLKITLEPVPAPPPTTALPPAVTPMTPVAAPPAHEPAKGTDRPRTKPRTKATEEPKSKSQLLGI